MKEKEFDACVTLDVIEHLTKPDGLALLETLASSRSKFNLGDLLANETALRKESATWHFF